ncbi:hypothetical protein NpPPO83_00010467 [Neofusicoccum parvum]|uniref:Uncharacterized protein n=1 Tax=Neofusicoccum parvum TaxID=310453 RepID=A0ACB5RVC0_9PEZI|nr:hypothetical protein NpPPO83_00010467 [Neofusicoccum parvum]
MIPRRVATALLVPLAAARVLEHRQDGNLYRILEVDVAVSVFGQPVLIQTSVSQDTTITIAADYQLTVTNAPTFVDTLITIFSSTTEVSYQTITIPRPDDLDTLTSTSLPLIYSSKYQHPEPSEHQLPKPFEHQFTGLPEYQLPEPSEFQPFEPSEFQLSEPSEYQLSEPFEFQLSELFEYQLSEPSEHQFA